MTLKQDPKKFRKKRKKNNWAPLLLGLGGLVLVVVAALALTRGNSEPEAEIEVNGSPSLRVDQEAVDLGDVRLNQLAEASFTITNVGDQPLRFEEEPYIEVVEGC